MKNMRILEMIFFWTFETTEPYQLNQISRNIENYTQILQQNFIIRLNKALTKFALSVTVLLLIP